MKYKKEEDRTTGIIKQLLAQLSREKKIFVMVQITTLQGGIGSWKNNLDQALVPCLSGALPITRKKIRF